MQGAKEAYIPPLTQSLSRVYPSKFSISITPALNMADTEPKVVEEVPAAMEEEAQDPKVVVMRKMVKLL